MFQDFTCCFQLLCSEAVDSFLGEIPESNVDLYGSIDHENSPEAMELYQILSDGEIQVKIISLSFLTSFKCFCVIHKLSNLGLVKEVIYKFPDTIPTIL